jgi:hypothetical protein
MDHPDAHANSHGRGWRRLINRNGMRRLRDREIPEHRDKRQEQTDGEHHAADSAVT